ncbi:hypothetical protein RHMOL_Rhmol06G0005600 [Rhododendron molle]|uniref:Uncharacterized protein n=1 Tax=Rhododendron molle TaxID=49168 RepID=A0ACC0N8E8_RHOML|nr:hypothetical protein RHMOL_Rhmol06G0005600 [Rhododendron molle]
MVGAEAGGPQISRLDPRSSVEGSVVIGLGSIRASGSGGGGGDQSGQPRRDPARGKDPVTAEETPREVLVKPVEFRPAVGSSVHAPITCRDFAEFVTDEELSRLLRENPVVVAVVIRVREDRQRQVERAQKEEDLRTKAERAEKAREEEPWTYEVAVTLAESI